ncbi:MAG: hypothetical protein MZW92_50300 [Comamonadaceae bacterium]|nr:hypothetical protein [Comamonadaceae bacterium]
MNCLTATAKDDDKDGLDARGRDGSPIIVTPKDLRRAPHDRVRGAWSRSARRQGPAASWPPWTI